MKLAIVGGPRAISRDLKFHTTPEITAADEEAVLASLRQGTHAGWGPNCVKLQEDFAQWNGNRFCVAANSGTSALHMSVAAAGAGAGDEVVTSAVSWISSATCILHNNAIPIFVDVEWETMLIDPAAVESALSHKTKAILPVHYWGVPCDMDAINEVARRHGLRVIEDACQAHGSLYKGRKAGTLGDCAAFSLNEVKALCGGEGGLFVTDDEEMLKTGRALMNFGEMKPSGRLDFHAHSLGWNYLTSDLPAALARSQLKRLDQTNEIARRNWHHLHARLDGVPNLVRPFATEQQQTNGYAYVLRCDREVARSLGYPLARVRDGIAAALRAEGLMISPRRDYVLPAHALFQERKAYGSGCPWTCTHSRPDISYDLSRYPNAADCVDSFLIIKYQLTRHPNGLEQVDAIADAIVKVFTQLNEVPIPSSDDPAV